MALGLVPKDAENEKKGNTAAFDLRASLGDALAPFSLFALERRKGCIRQFAWPLPSLPIVILKGHPLQLQSAMAILGTEVRQAMSRSRLVGARSVP